MPSSLLHASLRHLTARRKLSSFLLSMSHIYATFHSIPNAVNTSKLWCHKTERKQHPSRVTSMCSSHVSEFATNAEAVLLEEFEADIGDKSFFEYACVHLFLLLLLMTTTVFSSRPRQL